jgi:hypothetical protein
LPQGNRGVDVSGYRQGRQALAPKKIASLQIVTAATVAQVLGVASLGLPRELDWIENQNNC